MQYTIFEIFLALSIQEIKKMCFITELPSASGGLAPHLPPPGAVPPGLPRQGSAPGPPSIRAFAPALSILGTKPILLLFSGTATAYA